MKRVARTLKTKAISSFRPATAAFNRVEDDGRQTAVLLHLQHAFEMLLKGALRVKAWTSPRSGSERTVGRSIGYEKCVRLARQHLNLTEEQCGTLRAIDAMRDDEQHWIADFSEGLLYLHARAGVTLFDEILHNIFDERLADHLPERVLPISTTPPTDIEVLINEQLTQVQELLRPGQRKRVEARDPARTAPSRATSPRTSPLTSATSTASRRAFATAAPSTRFSRAWATSGRRSPARARR